MNSIKMAVLQYARDHHALPARLIDVQKSASVVVPITDHWGRAINYRVDRDGGITLMSRGRDGRPGGAGEDKDIIGVFPSAPALQGRAPETVRWSRAPLQPWKEKRAGAPPKVSEASSKASP
jgi:hypothetical protein